MNVTAADLCVISSRQSSALQFAGHLPIFTLIYFLIYLFFFLASFVFVLPPAPRHPVASLGIVFQLEVEYLRPPVVPPLWPSSSSPARGGRFVERSRIRESRTTEKAVVATKQTQQLSNI